MTALVLWLFLGHPGAHLQARLLPVQHAAFAMLMPGFSVQTFELTQRGPHLKLRATSVNTRYLLGRDGAQAPGAEFDVESPARMGPLHGVLIVLGVVWLAKRGSRRQMLALALATAVCALAMSALTTPLILAGQQWGLMPSALETASLPALWLALSSFLLHGGGFALSATTAWALVALSSRPGVGKHRQLRA
jgi:hypothetical protein